MEVSVRQQSLCLLLGEGESRKSRALRINCRMCGCCFKTHFGNFCEWMDKLGKCVCCAYQKRRNVTKVGRPTEKRTFRCPRGRIENLSPQEFALRAEQRLGTAPRSPWNCKAMVSQIREELNTPTDNEQLLRLKRMSKSPHSNPRLGDLAL